MPPGTVLFRSESVPCALNYMISVLQNFFMPGMYVLTNLSAA